MDDKSYGIDEMKMAADDIKKLRPIQEAILVALKIKKWEEVPDVLMLEVTASRLARFMVRISLSIVAIVNYTARTVLWVSDSKPPVFRRSYDNGDGQGHFTDASLDAKVHVLQNT